MGPQLEKILFYCVAVLVPGNLVLTSDIVSLSTTHILTIMLNHMYVLKEENSSLPVDDVDLPDLLFNFDFLQEINRDTIYLSFTFMIYYYMDAAMKENEKIDFSFICFSRFSLFFLLFFLGKEITDNFIESNEEYFKYN